MDKIHEVEKKLWISKDIYSLAELISRRKQQLLSNEIHLREEITDCDMLKQELKNFIQTNKDNIKSTFSFNSDDERALVIDDDCDLATYKLQLVHARKLINSRIYRINYLSKLKLTRREILMRHLASVNYSRQIDDLIYRNRTDCQDFETLLTIHIWPQPSKSNKIRLQKEIIFKSSSCLLELRNQIKCQMDYGVPVDLSENPEQSERVLRGELFKSAFFLIHDTFYNDLRDVNNYDLSQTIIDWASKPVEIVDDQGNYNVVDRGIGPFKSARMETKTFNDLNFRLGCPYLYLHQGSCEHLFTISDIRYVPNDVCTRDVKFPLITACSIGLKTDYIKCYMCKERPPQWYTRFNERLPVDPFLFCEECFYSFNYDEEMKKLGNFQAFLYSGVSGIPDNVEFKSPRKEVTES